MTQPSALPATSPTGDPSALQRLTLFKDMQTLLSYPPTAKLTDFVKTLITKTEDPLMKGFLNLLITGDQSHRDLAAQIFHQLESRVAQDRQAEIDQAAVKAAELLTAAPDVGIATVTSSTSILAAPHQPMDLIEPDEESSYEEAMAAWTRRSAELVREASQPEEAATAEPTGAKIVDLQARRAESVIAPYATPEGEHYTLRYSGKDGVVTKEEVYSILTVNTQFTQSPLQALHQLRGVVIGIQGQSTVEHGFGYILPLDGIDLLPADQSTHIPVRLEYPSAMPIYDDHNAANVPGLKEFIALHETLRKGYTVCLDLYVKVNAHPSNGHSLSLTVRQEKLILRRQPMENGYGADGAMFSSVDLEDLHSATKKLALVGVIANHLSTEVPHG